MRRLPITCLIALLLTACASPLATLNSVTTDDRVAVGALELGEARVYRDGELLTTEVGMRIQKGDSILTGPDTEIVLDVTGGYRVYVDENSELVIVNPKLLLRLGRAFVETLQRVKEALTVDTEYVVAGVEGTAFELEVSAEGVVTCTVVEGTVQLRPKDEADSWGPIPYGARERVTVVRDERPSSVDVLQPQELENEIAWVREIQRITIRFVPQLLGLTEAAAQRAILDENLEVGRIRQRITGEAEAGTVIEQSIESGERVDVGARIDLVVEQASVLVPELTGRPRDEAVELLQDAELRAGRVREQLTENTPDGTVVGQSPRAGRRVELETRVELTVAIEGVRVPGVAGLTQREATRRLRDAGLNVGRTSEVRSSSAAPGTVVRSDPARRKLVRVGSSVTLEVAASCVVPDLVRRTEEEVREILTEAGLRIGNVRRLQYGTTVTGQDPEAGREVSCGSRVNITIGTDIG